jgi:hypothetical protein
LVSALSTRYGVCPRLNHLGKIVWAELPTG